MTYLCQITPGETVRKPFIFKNMLMSLFQNLLHFFTKREQGTAPPKLTICFNNETVLHFENMIQRKKTFPVFTTSVPIRMENFPFGADMSKVTERKGPPHCINNDRFGDEMIEIFGYRESILNLPAKILFFTCRKNYFFGEYQFTGKFRDVQAELARTILAKYETGNKDPADSFYIVDGEGALLGFYDDGFSLFIKYYKPDPCVHPFLMTQFKDKNSAAAERDISELENRL